MLDCWKSLWTKGDLRTCELSGFPRLAQECRCPHVLALRIVHVICWWSRVPVGMLGTFFNANMNVFFFQYYCFQPFVLVNRKNSVLFSSTASFQPQDPVSKSQSGSIVPCFSFTYSSPPGPSISMPMTPLMCSLALVYLDITTMRKTIKITVEEKQLKKIWSAAWSSYTWMTTKTMTIKTTINNFWCAAWSWYIPVIVVWAILPHTEDQRLCIDLLVESQSPGSSCNLKSLGIMVKMGKGAKMGIITCRIGPSKHVVDVGRLEADVYKMPLVVSSFW